MYSTSLFMFCTWTCFSMKPSSMKFKLTWVPCNLLQIPPWMLTKYKEVSAHALAMHSETRLRSHKTGRAVSFPVGARFLSCKKLLVRSPDETEELILGMWINCGLGKENFGNLSEWVACMFNWSLKFVPAAWAGVGGFFALEFILCESESGSRLKIRFLEIPSHV